MAKKLPYIQKTEHFEHDVVVISLHIPRSWFVVEAYPRLKLRWWMLKMVWKLKEG